MKHRSIEDHGLLITRLCSLLERELAMSEGLNSQIQKIKRMACGFRNIEYFKTAIYFHCGGLDLYLC
ncbi:MAG: transposase [Nitrospira sp.]